jgi:hypothetical protein
MKTTVKTLIPIFAILVATWMTYRLHGSPQTGIDDANITFSYSENLAAGHGMIYGHNPERVEGFTSMLWTLLCALIFKLGLGERGVLALSVFLLCIVQILFLHIVRSHATARGRESWPYECVYLLLVISSPSYITWMTITLMDTCLWGFLLACLTFVAIDPPRTSRGRILAILLIVLASLARPEAMILVPAMIGLIWLRAQSTDHPHTAKLILGMLGAFVATLTALTIFRLFYFGYPFPNTYYAKVSPSLIYNLTKGKDYLFGFASSSQIVGVCVLAVVLSTVVTIGGMFKRVLAGRHAEVTEKRPIEQYKISALVATVLLIVPALTGGDHFQMFRFYQPAYPIMCLTIVLLLSKAGVFLVETPRGAFLARARQSPVACVAALVIGTYWLFAWAQGPKWNSMRRDSPMAVEFTLVAGSISQGEKLKTLFSALPQLPSIGVVISGAIARIYPGRIVDLMGLNNSFIAHFKGDRKGMKNHAAFEKDAFFAVEPDVLLVSPPIPPKKRNRYSLWLKDVFSDPRFIENWRYGILLARSHPDRKIEWFFNNRFLQKLRETPEYEFQETMKWSGKWKVSFHP